MTELIKIFLIIHVAAGSVALLAGLIAIFLRNKVKLHRPAGKVYYWAMTVVFITAVFISLVKGNVFLFCVAVFTYYSCLTAYRSLRLKKLHLDQRPMWYDWVIEVVFGLIHIGFVVFALMKIGKHPEFGIIALVFGLIGVNGNITTIKRFRAKNFKHKNYWLLAHIGGMLGSYIGAFTAFIVNNGNHIPAPPIVLWLGPTVLLVPFMMYELNIHKKKGGLFQKTE
ncbi:MAG TPA: DUF2306 domain-containing protein [Bacteroidia bacterium]|nr:DUF2306 domain-containing protein [Bacteroidia bacterium]